MNYIIADLPKFHNKCPAVAQINMLLINNLRNKKISVFCNDNTLTISQKNITIPEYPNFEFIDEINKSIIVHNHRLLPNIDIVDSKTIISGITLLGSDQRLVYKESLKKVINSKTMMERCMKYLYNYVETPGFVISCDSKPYKINGHPIENMSGLKGMGYEFRARNGSLSIVRLDPNMPEDRSVKIKIKKKKECKDTTCKIDNN
jgi:hypothetical protein